MSDKPTTPILLVYIGVRQDANDKLSHWWLHVTDDEFRQGKLPESTELNTRMRCYGGKESRKRMTGTPGTVYEVPEVTEGDKVSIYPGESKYKGLWPDDNQRTHWQVEHRTATTTVDLRKRSKQEGSEDNFSPLLPFREKYRKLVSQDQRAALLAQMIAFVTAR